MLKEWKHSGSKTAELSAREREHQCLARKVAVEGIVLLKNEAVLPLNISDPVAIFGNGAEKTVKGGIGSGDVNNRRNVSIYQGMKEAGAIITSENWIQDYEKRYEDARQQWKEKVLEEAKKVENPFDAYAANPFDFPEGRQRIPTTPCRLGI